MDKIEIKPLEVGFGVVNTNTGIVYDVCETKQEAETVRAEIIKTLCKE